MKISLEKIHKWLTNMKFANIFCYADFQLHGATIHHGGILSFVCIYIYSSLLCFTVHCPTHIPINNGIARFNKDRSFVTFRCVSGLKLVGSLSATCREDGTWSSPPPVCTSKCNTIHLNY